ncbi:MAG: 50S ribosomal protein L9, partial [Pseudomonadota bacterium]
EDEAERQAAGEDLTARDEQFEHDAVDFDEDDIDLSEVFEEREGDDDADVTEEEAPAEEAEEEEADKA